MEYIVLKPEIHIVEIYVDANAPEEARGIVDGGGGSRGTDYILPPVPVHDGQVDLTVAGMYEVFAADSKQWEARERELKSRAIGY